MLFPPPWTPLIIQFTRVQVELYSGVFNNVLDSTKVVSGNHAGQFKEENKQGEGGGGIFNDLLEKRKIRHLAGFSFFFVLFPRNLFIFPKNH